MRRDVTMLELVNAVLAAWPLRLELQNVGTDPGLCRKLGNEIYCY